MLERDNSKSGVDAKFSATASKIDFESSDAQPSGQGHESAPSEGVGASLQKGTVFGSSGGK